MSASLNVLSQRNRPSYTATRNACKLCTPLGATLVFRGVEGAVPFLHGSQGCATYMRRYIISHFREPMDIAASGFSEASAVFGGGPNLFQGIRNVASSYHPKMIGIATTCLTETIGEDLKMLMYEFESKTADEEMPLCVHVSTPSYSGTHMEGFHAAVLAIVEKLASADAGKGEHVNLFPGMVSAEDMRYLKDVFADFGLPLVMLPDYSKTLDGVSADRYIKIPEGGAPIAALRTVGVARSSIELGATLAHKARTAATHLQSEMSVPALRMGLPIGIRESDLFFAELARLSGRATPERHAEERGRLVDAYVDAHKYVFGKRVILYGEEDLVVGLASLCSEIGLVPVMCASGGRSGHLKTEIARVTPELKQQPLVREGCDFMTIEEEARQLDPDMFIGNSKGYRMARSMGKPLVRVGFPIHDRIGGQRIAHLGYRGAQRLFDHIVNELMAAKQEASPISYSYL